MEPQPKVGVKVYVLVDMTERTATKSEEKVYVLVAVLKKKYYICSINFNLKDYE